MNVLSQSSLVVPSQFIEAARDSGYKSLGSALAELIDNSFEAKATAVRITLRRDDKADHSTAIVSISDNGRGMDAATCGNALRFGWSSRFNWRDGHGRYGMGLPNVSLSHARRVEILSSVDGLSATRCYLDADDFSAGSRDTIPDAEPLSLQDYRSVHPFKHGTTVIWRKCDRLEGRYLGPLTKRLDAELGRLFRYQIWAGKVIKLNGKAVRAVDPLFERSGAGLSGAKGFGPELRYEVASIKDSGESGSFIVLVRFTELPVAEWHSMSNAQKNAAGISKGAGISILRAGREIDYGWFFMGQKRQENYDDWWRCEIQFDPDLDELFGVTHTKQEIHPTEQITAILTPDMERIARELNARARKAFASLKAEAFQRDSEKRAEKYDNLIEPPRESTRIRERLKLALRRGGRGRIAGLEYQLRSIASDGLWFFQPDLEGARLSVFLNERHPFFQKGHWRNEYRSKEEKELQNALELLILAAARAEVTVGKEKKLKMFAQQFRETWSNILATFLS